MVSLLLIEAAYSTDFTTVWITDPEITLQIDSTNVSLGELLTINVSIQNLNGYNAAGNLTIKIGQKAPNQSGFEYPADWLLIGEKTIGVNAGGTYQEGLTWLAAETYSLEDTYKVYLRFDYNGSYTTRSQQFYLKNKEEVPSGGEGGII